MEANKEYALKSLGKSNEEHCLGDDISFPFQPPMRDATPTNPRVIDNGISPFRTHMQDS